MGIENLLLYLRPALEPVHISKYKGKTAAIDASCWLYKGCFSCAREINLKEPTTAYLHVLQKTINLL
jgi:exonuclease-1